MVKIKKMFYMGRELGLMPDDDNFLDNYEVWIHEEVEHTIVRVTEEDFGIIGPSYFTLLCGPVFIVGGDEWIFHVPHIITALCHGAWTIDLKEIDSEEVAQGLGLGG